MNTRFISHLPIPKGLDYQISAVKNVIPLNRSHTISSHLHHVLPPIPAPDANNPLFSQGDFLGVQNPPRKAVLPEIHRPERIAAISPVADPEG